MIRPRDLPLSRIAAQAILMSIIVLAIVIVVAPLWSAWSAETEEVARLTDLIGRLRRTAAEAPDLRAQLDQLGVDQRNSGAILVAANPNLAAAALQSEFRRIVEAAGGQVQAVQQLPPIKEDALTRISIRANLQADTGQIAHALYDIEGHSPVFLIQSLSIRGVDQPAAQRNVKPPPLNIQVEVAAMTAASE
jgi:hypothetical protein